jgi:hypothetical protein
MKHSAEIAGMREDDWLSLADLRALCDGHTTLDELATAIEQERGWRPSRAQMRAELDRLGLSGLGEKVSH